MKKISKAKSSAKDDVSMSKSVSYQKPAKKSAKHSCNCGK